MTRISTLWAIVLSFALIFAGQGMAFARTQAPADGQMVLCTGHGSFVVYVDEDGQPTSAPQLCTDCSQALSTALWQAFELAPRALTFFQAKHARTLSQHPRVLAQTGAARAPPVDVI